MVKMRIIINAENLILGRLASFAAKKAMEGNQIDIINSDKAVMTGSKETLFNKYKIKRDKGGPLYGPFFPREPEMIVRRTIRGMIPHKQEKGKTAYKNVKCYIGIPKELKGKEFITLEKAKLKESAMRYMEVGSLAKLLGSHYES